MCIVRTSVRLGEYDTSNDPDCSTSGFCAPTVINHMISHVVIHPDYKHGQYHHDIALVILKTPLNYTGEFSNKTKNKIIFSIINLSFIFVYFVAEVKTKKSNDIPFKYFFIFQLQHNQFVYIQIERI